MLLQRRLAYFGLFSILSPPATYNRKSPQRLSQAVFLLPHGTRSSVHIVWSGLILLFPDAVPQIVVLF